MRYVPSAAEYAKAFEASFGKCTDFQRSFVINHYKKPGMATTATELARSVGHSSFRVTNRWYGQLAKNIVEELGLDTGGCWLHAFVTFEKPPNSDHLLHLRPEVAKALEMLGWVKPSEMNSAYGEQYISEIIAPDVTEREFFGNSRVGQDVFRKKLLQYWERCAVTGVCEDWLLRASHIKPWKDCNDQERLDQFNGLLLTPALDTAFDSGHISFSNEGTILISKCSVESLSVLGIHSDMRIEKLSPEHFKYLAYHRENLFQKES